VKEIDQLDFGTTQFPDPCHLVWQVNQILRNQDMLQLAPAIDVHSKKSLIHLPGEPAGV
jgi:hypothetical protein